MSSGEARSRTAIVLGGSVVHLPLVHEMKARGFHVVLVDYLPDPPAKAIADEHVQLSTLDKEAVLELARERKADVVINTSLDQAIPTAGYVAERLGLPAPYGYQAALDLTDKSRMKRLMLDNSIPTSRFVVIPSTGDPNSHGLGYPVMVKPADGTGSIGVERVESEADLKKCFANAAKHSRSGQVIVEEFCRGKEWNIYAFVLEGKAHRLLILEKQKILHGYDHGMQQVGSIMPAAVEGQLDRIIAAVTERIVDVFGIRNSPLLIQAMVERDRVSVIEVAARLGGTGLSTRIIQENSGFDIMGAAIDVYLGNKVNAPGAGAGNYYASNFIYAAPGVIGDVLGLEELKRDGTIEEFFVMKGPGSSVPEGMSSKNRVASFFVRSRDRGSLFERIERAVQRIDVVDSHGVSIMRKDIRLNER